MRNKIPHVLNCRLYERDLLESDELQVALASLEGTILFGPDLMITTVVLVSSNDCLFEACMMKANKIRLDKWLVSYFRMKCKMEGPGVLHSSC